MAIRRLESCADILFLVKVILQLAAAAGMTQFTQSLRFDLTDTLSCNVEFFSNFLESSGTAVIQSETKTENLLLTVSKSA